MRKGEKSMKVFQIVAVKDELTEAFLTPAFVSKKEEGIRSFAWQINNNKIWKDNAADFSLYHLGTFDEITGTLIGNNPVKITGGRSVLRREENQE